MTVMTVRSHKTVKFLTIALTASGVALAGCGGGMISASTIRDRLDRNHDGEVGALTVESDNTWFDYMGNDGGDATIHVYKSNSAAHAQAPTYEAPDVTAKQFGNVMVASDGSIPSIVVNAVK